MDRHVAAWVGFVLFLILSLTIPEDIRFVPMSFMAFCCGILVEMNSND